VADDVAVGKHGLDAGDEILGDAVLDRTRPTGALGQVAPEKTAPAAGGIRGVEESLGLHGLLEHLRDDTRLDRRHEVTAVDLEDAVEPRGGKHDAAADRKCAPGKTRPRAPGRHRHPVRRRDAHDLGHLRGGRRRHHHLRQEDQILGLVGPGALDRLVVGGDVAVAQSPAECVEHGGCHAVE
jgi:hypothetical protein